MGTFLEKAVVLEVTFRRPGIRRKGDLCGVVVDSDISMLRLSKAIIDSPEYNAIAGVGRRFRSWLGERAIPCSTVLRGGMVFVPIDLLEDIYAKLDEAEREFSEAVEKFLVAYPAAVNEARERLRTQFDEKDYPSEEKLRASFGVSRNLIDFAPPGQSKVGRVIWEREQERARRILADAVEEIRGSMRAALADLVGHLADRLTPPAPGAAPKVLYKNALDNVREWVELFSRRDVTDDTELAQLCDQVKGSLRGLKVGWLKDSAALSASVAEKMASVKAALDAQIGAAPARKFTFSDDTSDNGSEG